MINEIDVMQYLTERFSGVSADSAGIKKRYDNYVQFKFAAGLIEYIVPYLDKNKMILDIGSGFGSFVYLLREKGYHAYGIEIVDFLIAFARQRLQQNSGFTSQDCIDIYRKNSALSLPFPDNYFDIITIWNVLEHIHDYKKAIQEAIRTLKVGGKMFILNINYAMCFMEPHYRVPWLPFLPKNIAKFYLKFIGRNTDYIENGIFYTNHFGITTTLLKEKMHISSARVEKLSGANPVIVSKKKIIIWKIITCLKVNTIFTQLFKVLLLNPFCSYTNIIATKK